MILKAIETQSRYTLDNFGIDSLKVEKGVINFEGARSMRILVNTDNPLSFNADGASDPKIVAPKDLIAVIFQDAGQAMRFHTDGELIMITIDEDFLASWLGSDLVKDETIFCVYDNTAKDLLSAISASISRHGIAEASYLRACVLAFLNYVVCNRPTRKCHSPKGKLSYRQMFTLIELVKKSIHQDLHLGQMAEVVHLSEFHFSRLFRNTFGISPYQFVLHMKVECAKQIMKHYPKSLSQIAHSLHFTDQAHFTNVFKKMTGLCPTAFISSHQSAVL